jgi:PLD-like domain
MKIKLIEAGWEEELRAALEAEHATVRIVCPFIKRHAAERLLEYGHPETLQVITRFNLADFCTGVSDMSALRVLVEAGAEIRGIRHLHAKLYLFGKHRAIVTSANLTQAGLQRNPRVRVYLRQQGSHTGVPPILQAPVGYSRRRPAPSAPSQMGRRSQGVSSWCRSARYSLSA